MVQKSSSVLVMALILHFSSLAQQDRYAKTTNVTSNKALNKPQQAVFGEVFGKSLMFSINYDRRIGKNTNGLGFVVGAGIIALNGSSIYSLPASLNYLMGKNGKFLELGAGASLFNVNDQNFNGASKRGYTVVPITTIGYRSQPRNGGFIFRAGLNQLLFKNYLLPYYPYVSFGYSF